MGNWNYLCDAVAEGKRRKIKEDEFQKIMGKFFEGVLYWSSIKKTMREQYVVGFAHTKGLVDIALLNDRQQPEVIIELKRPNHNQRQDDVKQLWDYMKITGCLFGIYIGEKLELYYDELYNRTEPKLVVALSFTKENLCGDAVLGMLEYTAYSREKLDRYCKNMLTVQMAVNHWMSPKGKKEILDFVVKQSKIEEDCVDILRGLIDIDVVDLSGAGNACIGTSKSCQDESAHEAKPHDNTLYSLDNEIFLSKRAFAFQVVKKITEDYPNMSYDKILSLFNSKTVIRKKEEWEKLSPDSKSRYCDKENQILKASDGMEFLVSDQWTKKKIDSIIKGICDHFQWKYYTK